jgi:ribosomal protein L40E
MICNSCGATIADKAIVCYRCGAPTAAPKPSEAARKAAGAAARRPWVALLLVLAGLAFGAWTLLAAAPAAWPASERFAAAAVALLVVVVGIVRLFRRTG